MVVYPESHLQKDWPSQRGNGSSDKRGLRFIFFLIILFADLFVNSSIPKITSQDLSYSKEVEAEFTNDPGKALNAVKMDILLKWHEESRADLKKILGFCDPENKKMDWGTFVFFGRKM